jgi:tetratricopeptide (TPR) repeat protein/transcriptional regulator with XRE-family HTH domain
MAQVAVWTGFEANLLRTSLRMSLRGFAEHLGVSPGTVSLWSRRGASVQPIPEMQAVLDTALARAPDEARERFQAGLFPTETATTPDPLAEPRPVASQAHEVLLTVHVDGRAVTLPLDSVAAAARAAAAGPVTTGHELMSVGTRRWLMRTSESRDERAYELFVRGYGLLGGNDRRQINAAQELLQKAVDRDPRFARAIAARGYASWRRYFAGWSDRSQALQDALRDVEAALEVDPGSIGAHTTFVRACWDMGWHERALEAGRAIHDDNPDSLDATVAFARSLNNAGLAQHALPLLNRVLAEDPGHPPAVKLRVWCYLMVCDYRRALESARGYLERTPTDANTRWAVALAASRLSDTVDQAVDVAEQGLDADSGDVTLWVLLGYLHRARGEEDAARASWAEGLMHVPVETNQRTLAWRANLLAAIGDVRGADRAVDALVGRDPHNGYLRYRMVHVLAEAGHRSMAVEMLDQAVIHGFLSAQLLRQELTLGLAPLRSLSAFRTALERLDASVARCRRRYADGLSAVPYTIRDLGEEERR